MSRTVRMELAAIVAVVLALLAYSRIGEGRASYVVGGVRLRAPSKRPSAAVARRQLTPSNRQTTPRSHPARTALPQELHLRGRGAKGDRR